MSLSQRGALRRVIAIIAVVVVGGMILGLTGSFEVGEAKVIKVADVRECDFWERLMFTSLQGIANRQEPHIFLIFNDTDYLWIEYYQKEYGLEYEMLDDPYELFDGRTQPFDGYIICDPEVPDTANLAATYASIEDLLPVTEVILEKHKLPDLKVKRDLRGHFWGMSKSEIYQWAFNNLWDNCNRDIVACLVVPDNLSIDISEYTADMNTIFLKFEDSKPEDGSGAKFDGLEIVKNGKTIIEIVAGKQDEKEYLVDADGSWLERDVQDELRERLVYADGDRVADCKQYWIYKIKGVQGAERLRMRIQNEYLVSISKDRYGPYKEIARNTTWGLWRSNRIRDYVIAHRGFFFDLSSDPEEAEEYALKGRILEAMEPQGYVLGWSTDRCGEGLHVKQSSEHGKLVICSLDSPNFSLHQHIKAKEPFQQPGKVTPDKINVKQDKIYVCYVLSDGDALHWISRFQGKQWLMDERGDCPFGWEVQPLLYDLGSGMLEYYFKTATENDCLVASASGIGYTYPDVMPPQTLREHLKATKPYLSKADLTTMIVLTYGGPVNDEEAAMYGEVLSEELVGCIEGYWNIYGEPRLCDNLSWVPTESPLNVRQGVEMLAYLNQIASYNPQRPLFVPIHVLCGDSNVADMGELTKRLNPDIFEVVRPDEFLIAFRKARAGTVIIDVGPMSTRPGSGVEPPAEISVISGMVNRIPCNIRSFANEPVEVEAQVQVKSDNWVAESEWVAKEVLPSERTAVVCDVDIPPYPPEGEAEANLVINYKGKMTHITIPVRILPWPKELLLPAAVSYSGKYESEYQAHQAGEFVDDHDALNGSGWHAAVKRDEGSYVVFGPYTTDQKPGSYIALFRLKVADNTIGQVVAEIDAAEAPKFKNVATRKLRGIDFSKANTYQEFAIPFKRTEEGTMEYRVFYLGGTDLTIDRVTVFGYEPA